MILLRRCWPGRKGLVSIEGIGDELAAGKNPIHRHGLFLFDVADPVLGRELYGFAIFLIFHHDLDARPMRRLVSGLELGLGEPGSTPARISALVHRCSVNIC